MKKKVNLIRNLIIFILLIILTFTIIFKDNSFYDIFSIMANAKFEYIFIAIGAMFAYLCLEAVNIGRTLKILGEKFSPIYNTYLNTSQYHFHLNNILETQHHHYLH